MTYWLIQATYSPWTWIYRVTKDPRDMTRPPDIIGVLQAAGVKLHGIWYSFGEYDLTAIGEVEKNEDMATLVIGMRAGWDGKAFDKVKVTPLLTTEEISQATAKAATGLAKSRDATKEGPLIQETIDYSNLDFRAGSGTPESKKTYDR